MPLPNYLRTYIRWQSLRWGSWADGLFWQVISGNRGGGRGVLDQERTEPFEALLLLGHGCRGGSFMVVMAQKHQ